MSVANPSKSSNPFRSWFSGFSESYIPRYDYGLNVYFEDGKLLTGILVGLIYVAIALSLDAAGYVESMGLLIPVTLAAFGLGLLMSYSRFDGFFAISHSMFVGLALILYLMTGRVEETEITSILNNGVPDLQARAYFILIQWVDWVTNAIGGSPENSNYVFVFEICFLMWWLTYLGVWSIYRYGYTWRAIIPAGAVLVINAYYAPKSIVGFLVVFAMLALVLLVRTNLAEHQLRWRERRIHFNPDISLDFLRNGLAFSVAVIAIAWLAPSLGKNVQVRTVLEPVNTWWEEQSESLNNLYPSLNRRTRPTAASFGPKLTLGGERNFGNSQIFHVDADSGRYWRAVTYDTYTGTEWFNTNETEVSFDVGDIVPVGDWGLREPLTQTITLIAPTGGVVFGAPDIIRASVPLVSNYNTVATNPIQGSVTPSGVEDGTALELTMTRTNRSLEPGDQYTVVSWQTDITKLALRDAGTDYPSEEFLERYTALPESFSDEVRQLAVDIAGDATNPYDSASRLENYLRTNFEYDEQIPAPPEGTDPVMYFLYDIQRGYCDYYATSMATMLRSLGIPTRTASGYAEGTYQLPDGIGEDPLSPAGVGDGIYVISERDAHTWVEVYFPGFGWVEFEPTAGESSLSRPEGLTGNIPERDPLDLDPFGENPDFEDPLMDDGAFPEDFPDDGGGLFGGGSGGGFGVPTQFPWLTSLAMILAALAGGWFFLRKSVSFGPTSFTPDLAPILFERMHIWAARLGITTAASDTPYEQANRISRVLPEGRQPIERITDSYVQHQFGREASLHSQDLGAELPKGQSRILTNPLELPENWKKLQSLFFRAWFSKLTSRFSRFLPSGRSSSSNNPYALSE